VQIEALFTDPDKRAALEDMGIHTQVGSAKLDLAIRADSKIIGGLIVL
jgi:hypothetical protein